MSFIQLELFGQGTGDYKRPEIGNRGPWLRVLLDSEIVETYRKKQRVILSPEWQEFYKLMFTLTGFGEAERARAFERVLARPEIYDQGFIPVLFGGSLVRRLDERVYRPNSIFGEAYKIETLDASNPPPDAGEVFRERRWLWGGLDWNREGTKGRRLIVPVLNITYGGWNFVQRGRVEG